jgi:hypothetical protein
MPNKSVKWDAPPLGAFEVVFLSKVSGFAKVRQAARPLP